MESLAAAQGELLRLAVEHSPDAVVLCAPDDEIIYWSPGAEATFGHRSADAVGQRWCELALPAEQRAGELQARRQAPGADRTVRAALRRHRDGHLFYADTVTRPVYRDDGALRCYVVSSRDVTALTVERDAHLLEDRYRDLLEWVPDAIVIANEIGRIVLLNAQSEALFGDSRSAMLGRPIESLLPPRYGADHVGHRLRYQGQPQVRRMGIGLELFGLRADGREFPVEISLSPLVADGRRFVVSAIRDISQQKRDAQELQEKNAALELAHQAKDRFLATMSHELRTPLNAVLGFTSILLMKLPGALNAEQERQLGIVKSSGQHLLSLINDLLDLAKIQSGTYTLSPEPSDAGVLLAQVVQTLQPQAERKGLTLALAQPLHPAPCHVDRRALNQVMLNLANNAIKFTASGSVTFELRRDAGMLLISVVDTGVGIAEADIGRLFSSFTQVGDPKRRPEGTGLGLHLSARLAELMGGRIEVQSQLGVGSRFTLYLPLPAP
jgi:PAS domain S-box-containing protein